MAIGKIVRVTYSNPIGDVTYYDDQGNAYHSELLGEKDGANSWANIENISNPFAGERNINTEGKYGIFNNGRGLNDSDAAQLQQRINEFVQGGGQAESYALPEERYGSGTKWYETALQLALTAPLAYSGAQILGGLMGAGATGAAEGATAGITGATEGAATGATNWLNPATYQFLENPVLTAGAAGSAGTGAAGLEAISGALSSAGVPVTSATTTAASLLSAGGTVADVAAKTGLGLTDVLRIASVALPIVGGLTAGTGDKTATQTTTTSSLPTYAQGDASQLWNDYIDTVYGTGGQKGLQARTQEDTDYLKGLGDTYSADSKAAAQPYLELLSKQIAEGNAGTGLYTPTNITFGGNNLMSFVPKSNRNLASELLARANAQTTTNQGLADLNYKLGAAITPNTAANTYADKLGELATKLISGNQTTTQSATMPGQSTWANFLQGLDAATKIYGAYTYPWMQNTTKPTTK